MILRFTVYGVAEAKGSTRAFHRPGMRAPVITDSNRNVKAWQRLIADAAGTALAELPDADRRLIAGGARVEVTYFLPRPKALDRPKHAGAEHTKKPDLDKLTRAVLDALTAVAWTDDAQVIELVACKRYAALGYPAHVEIAVGPAALRHWQNDPAIFEAQLEAIVAFKAAAHKVGVL